MPRPSALISSVLAAAALFTLLFYRQRLGINLLLFEISIIALLFLHGRLSADRLLMVTVAGTLLSAVMVIVHHSILAVVVNMLSMFLMTGVLLFPKSPGLAYATAFSIYHLPFSQVELFFKLRELGSTRPALARSLRWLRIVAIPLLIVAVFAVIYSAANPVFDKMLFAIADGLAQLLDMLPARLDAAAVFTFILGVVICGFLLLRTTDKSLEEYALQVGDPLFRQRKPLIKKCLYMGLRREHRSSIFLLLSLNILLAIVNMMDIHWVWFNFAWDGDYLRQFVHEGTYLLIASMLISVGVILFIFRDNMSFLSANRTLRWLAYAWLAQNMVLAVSVAVRNVHYIHFYALAHKRIGVFFFLLATVIGLVTVIIKVRRTYGIHYLMRSNSMASYLLLLGMSTVNWDAVIARYNFAHAHRSFVHLDYLIELSDSAIPYLCHDLAALKRMEAGNARFPLDIAYLSAEEYLLRLERRKQRFATKMEDRHWLSWNLAEHRAHEGLGKCADMWPAP